MTSLIWITSAILILSCVNGEIRVSLNSNSWTVRNTSSDVRISATVPGGIYSDLNLTKNLLYRQNDIAYRWVGLEDWIYETKFELTKEILAKTAVNLVFHGVDTIGNISLNGQHIGSVNNMFVRYVFPIKEIAQVGYNSLEVHLQSPIKAANRSREESEYAIPPDCPNAVQHGECHINLLRKMQASFSWNMAPAVPSVGIWKPVEIEAFNTAIVRDVKANVRKENGTHWYVDATCYYERSTEDNPPTSGYGLVASLQIDGIRRNVPRIIIQEKQGELGKFSNNVTFDWQTNSDGSGIWWPNGYGHQTFLVLTCTFQIPNNEPENEISSKSIKVALRQIELIRDETLDDEGTSFYFKVNDVPIFAKGANWIPGHILPELGYDERMLRRTLQSVKDANMNMLRVWGGGVYESDLFYQICDELGILVWQDMMFTGALYPSDVEFLESVSTEIDQQVKRLQGHASLALWSGSDEVQQALVENWFKNENETYFDDYFTLFESTIKPIVEELDDSGRFVISSPSNGVNRTTGNVSEAGNPNDYKYGDVHHMNHNYDPWEVVRLSTARFVSKYGFLSLPSVQSISEVSLPGDWSLGSEFSKNRQHFPGAYEEIAKLIQYHFSISKGDPNPFESLVYYSQLSQALATKVQTEKFRKDRGNPDNEFSTTMGALYWHLNDVWQGPTWSSIEYGGRWKMLHYYAKKFFAPVIVIPEMTPKNEINVYIVSDLLNDANLSLSISLYSWDSFKEKSIFVNEEIVSNSSSWAYTKFLISESMKQTNCDTASCFYYFKVSGKGISAENFYYPTHFSKISNLAPAALSIDITKNENNPKEILINLEADRIIPFVWLETAVEGVFSDNGFTLIEKSVQIKFINPDENIDIDKVRNTLTIRSLDHTWYASGSGRIAPHKLSIITIVLLLISYLKIFN